MRAFITKLLRDDPKRRLLPSEAIKEDFIEKSFKKGGINASILENFAKFEVIQNVRENLS